ncbi:MULTISPECIES: type III pantothenate kinase [Spirosoma]|uniref:Type III pantothenate kinase n=1 Tax=Spirosoma liriopis TaxID=2937440 RepID=A0ABT0HRA9_9BACT|nr:MULTISPECIES: type III pantothenate kinase [Spirosoma]MCK8494362.1 type III pantothenate kinase [Spirosoma liriopis]UHG89373.1 type III pantothenate kinase [Spirosoma oryzicola]
MNLVIDWGNSSLKTAWFRDSLLVETGRYESVDVFLADWDKKGEAYKHPEQVLASSTSRSAEAIRTLLQAVSDTVWVLDGQTPVPVRKDYDTPTTLGTDRVAAAVGASSLFPGQDCLVFDLGTCLTADLVDRDAVFRGGLISPGLQMRFRAMHEQTARLPLVDVPTDWPDVTAKNTRQAMQSGVVNGMAFEMNGIIETYRRDRPDLVVLLCGGDAPVFESRLKQPIFAAPELVLVGLNRILRYNVENLHADKPGTIC